MRKRGVGISCVMHPSGMTGFGDPSQAAVQLKPDGTFALLVGAVDLGQGCLTILRQFAADALGVPIESIMASNFADDFAPLCTGSFASRVTLMDPHAVVNAVADLKRKIREWAAETFSVSPDDVEIADNKVHVKSDRLRCSRTMAELGAEVNWGGRFLVGTGAWHPHAFLERDPVTGDRPAVGAISFGACVAEVEVDTETGVVDLLKLVQVWEVGKVVNPLLCKAQVNGGLQIGLGFALTEEAFPYYPTEDFAPENLGDYSVPTFADYPEDLLWGLEEVPHPMGVEGAKGFSEGTSSGPPPAILSAIHDAIGVWITDCPATPEVILRALEADEARKWVLNDLKE
jgi:CO/xanthine dehydrogenase Mo-binding subunit